MKTEYSNGALRYGLLFVMLCIFGITGIAESAAPVGQVPTGPRDINGNWATPDYYTTANWANSPPLAKFVDTLPGLTAANANNLGQYLPLAQPDKTTYPGSDYYIIELREYKEKMHSDLNKTTLRGYVQVDGNGNDLAPIHYLGPVIVAERDRPVRLKFVNKLPTGSGGDLFIPVDASVMGAGKGPLTVGGQPCDNTVDNNTCASYTQNRADIHLHGGRTPWISDGTPHQWIVPNGENTPFLSGVSLQNVPDMPDPGPGAATYYLSNQQSARLMFYHDHAFGITRLNVYAGEAAGYLITDKYEQDLVTRGIIPADQIPLIIQDKTFVNATATTRFIYNPATGKFDTPITVPTVRATDPLWNWGSGPLDANGIRTPVTGDLWMPHVYMPAQQPTGSATGGVNPFGRWMYGPWFYPATAVTHGPVTNPYYDPNCGSPNPFELAQCETPGQPPLIPGTPHPSMGMEAFQDSAVVNGTVFPSLTVDPRAYRFRILNAAGDRFWNLSFYEADPAQVSPDPRLTAVGKSNLTEVKMLPASASLAAQFNWPPLWPTDGRDGGVPDPAFRGPNFLQIGTEGGFLPNPVIIEPQPITYMTDPTAFWVGVVDKMGLALGPAERADVIVDFSAYAGKTLILYNDAPAAWPARVPGYDYFTGAPDQRDSGGYGTGGTWDPITGTWVGGTGPLVGYAPNTRTVMQVIVRPALSGPGNSYNQANLEREFTAAAPATAVNPAPTKTLFERSQEPIIVGQPSYQSAYPNSYFPPNFPWEGVNQINDHFLQFVTIAGEPVKVPTEPKGIHDEMGASFDPEYGRMSGNLAMQLPNPTTLNALLVLYGFADIPTEFINNSSNLNVEVLPGLNGLPGTLLDGTQIWKISHNGVDTHPIHFHIFDVQLINRVGWDGQILMPEPNELGWKDTVKISPLMDTIVAVRPRAPALPFGIPNSLRPLNPAIPIDSAMGFSPVPTNGSAWPFFNSVDWATGQNYPANDPVYPYPNYKGVVTNVLYDFGWEFVWHCHILSHEEMDMMRPIVLKVDAVLPPSFDASATPNGASVDIIWNDPTPVNYATLDQIETYRNPANEIGFNVYRSTDGGLSFNKLNAANLLANSTTYTDTTPVAGAVYQVEAFNAKGSTFSPSIRPLVVTVAADGGPFNSPGPVNLTATITGIPSGLTITQVAFYNGTTLMGIDSNATGPYAFSWTNVAQGTYSITAKATDSQGVVTTSAPITVTVGGGIVASFTATGSALGPDIGFCETITLASTSTGPVTGYSWMVNGQNYLTSTVTVTLPPGTYPVTLTVVDSSTGVTAQVTNNVVVVNHAPTAVTGGPYTVAPGGSLVLNGSGTDPDACNTAPFSYAWNLDNKGANELFTANATIAYNTILKFLGFGTHTIRLTVTDSNGGSGSATTTLSVFGLPPTVTMTAPANGAAFGAPASITLTATAAADTGATITGVDFYNGTTKIGTGVLSAGVYSFTWNVTTAGSFSLTARATDSWGLTNDSTAVSVSVMAITTTALSTGNVNVAYSKTVTVSNGVAPYTWSATGLPAGLSIAPATGVISGTPNNVVPNNAAFAMFSVTITVQDSSVTPISTNSTFNLMVNQTAPAAPSGLTATATAANRVVLTWTDNANNDLGVRIQRATDSTFTAGLTNIDRFTANMTAFTDTTVVSGITYFYRVKSLNYVAFSTTPSNTALVTTPGPLAISTTSLTNGSVNVTYNQTVTGTGGIPPYTWSATGLPTGVSINPASGIISGTPSNVVPNNASFATFPVTITVQDSSAVPVTTNTTLNLKINQTAPAAPSGLTATAAANRVVLTWTDNANNDLGVRIQRATDSTFTTGLTNIDRFTANLTTFTDTTVVPGTTYFYRVKSLNFIGYSTTASNEVLVTTPTFGITTTSLPNGSVNIAYNQTVSTVGGTAPFTWSATGLPTNLSIDPATGVISGIPANVVANNAAFATFSVNITVTDNAAATANATLSLRINQTAPAAPSGLTANATGPTRVVLSWTDNANNDLGVRIERATDSTFTAGLTNIDRITSNLTTFTDTTVVPGTTYFYRVKSLNFVGYSTTASNEVSVTTPTFGITTTSLPNGSVNVAYNQTVSTVGGTAPFTWSATGLPTNLSIDPATGVISGIPANVVANNAAFATFSVNITVTDNAAATANVTLSLRINQTAPAAPSGLTANATGPTQVVLGWTDNANNDLGVRIERATDSTFTTGLTNIDRFTANLTTHTDTTVVSGTTYFYRVKSLNFVGYSTTASNEVSVTTP